MLSCDTMALTPSATEYNQTVLAKNSDRPTAEAQLLRYFPPRVSKPGARVKLTDLTIADVTKTYAVIGSQPYWIWGFEMGYNECGLVIGNEAQGSKCRAESETGILGMDLLRLALERAATAREGITVITSLLERYGQNANASALTDRRYENSFLLADSAEVWLLETAGREWAAKKIRSKIGISNCYQIGTDYDIISDGAEALARKSRWLASDLPFDFAKAYTKPAVRQTMAVPRMRRLCDMLFARDAIGAEYLKHILRDHFDTEINRPRNSADEGTFPSICMHMREWGESETAASIICRVDGELGVVARFAPAQPCRSAYIPVYFTGKIPSALSEGGRYFSERSLYWQLRRISLLCAVDDRFTGRVKNELRRAEYGFEQSAVIAEQNAKALLKEGKRDEAMALLNAVTDEAVETLMRLCNELYGYLCGELRPRGGIYGAQAESILKYIDYAKIPLDL